MRLIPFISLISLLFFIYVEVTVGNVFIRINSEGVKCFSITNVFKYIKCWLIKNSSGKNLFEYSSSLESTLLTKVDPDLG